MIVVIFLHRRFREMRNASHCFLSKKLYPSLLGTGWFQKWIWVWCTLAELVVSQSIK